MYRREMEPCPSPSRTTPRRMRKDQFGYPILCLGPVPGTCRRLCLAPCLGWSSAPHSRRRSASRSEEHTSELQSRLHLVCRLLLEKKKKNKNKNDTKEIIIHSQ